MRFVIPLVLALSVAVPAAAAPPRTYTLHVGQSATLVGAHAGDWVACRGLGNYAKTAVPGPGANVIRNVHVLTRRLALDVSAPRNGPVSASCRRR